MALKALRTYNLDNNLIERLDRYPDRNQVKKSHGVRDALLTYLPDMEKLNWDTSSSS